MSFKSTVLRDLSKQVLGEQKDIFKKFYVFSIIEILFNKLHI